MHRTRHGVRKHNGAENVTYTYDQSGHGSGIGRLTSVADAAGTLSRSYDEFGNLLTDVRTTSSASLTTAYSYDAANRIASITYPSGTLVSYTRDTMGRITGVTTKPSGGANQPVVSSIAYEPFGPYTGLTYGNGVAEARGFDQDYRLTTLTDTGSSPLQNLTYAYYPTNNVHTITDAVNAGNSQNFIYDNLQRLTQAAGGYGTYGYTYDNDGNRLTQTLGGVTTNYGIGVGNDLLQTTSMGGVTTQTIGYTSDGRMASFSPGIQSPGGQYITSLSYNQNARLSAVNTGGQALASYTYDGFGQRLLKTLSSSSGQIYQYGRNGMLLEETDQSGAAKADYIYLNGRPVATFDPSSGTLYFLHDDMLGTPQLATDGSQSTAWQATYKPFGQASVSGMVTQNLRFPGQYFDVESGWNHNGFRNYIADLGRYVEPDPLALIGTAWFYDATTGRLINEDEVGLQGAATILAYLRSDVNLYSYVGGDPTGFIDPLGLCWIYHQATGVMQHVDDKGNVNATFNGYSGRGQGLNNPNMQNVSGIGPLPRGLYTIGPMRNNRTGAGKTLFNSMRLVPDPSDKLFNRGGFLIHGDNKSHNHSASEGCIILSPFDRHKIADSDDNCLKVVE